MSRNAAKWELSVIYATAALLVVAVGGLIGRAAAVSAPDPYPDLYAQPPGDFREPENKTVYFTFDDGPSENTAAVLDVLQRQGVKGTFFVTGQNAEEPYAAEYLCRIVDEGHTLGLHSYSHSFDKIYRSADSYLADVDRLNDYLFETVGVRPDILRFPGGSATYNAAPPTMKEIIRELTRRGYLYYDWDVVSGDDTSTVYDAEYLAQRIVEGARNPDNPDREHVVVLLHDSAGPVTSPQAVDIAIDRFREMGYSFDRLTSRVEPVHIQSERLK